MKKYFSRSVWLLIVVVLQLVLPSLGSPTIFPDEEDLANTIGMQTELDAIRTNLVRYNLQTRIKILEDLIPSLEAADAGLTDALDHSSSDQREQFENATDTVQVKLLKAEAGYERRRTVQQQFPAIENGIWSQLSSFHKRVLSSIPPEQDVPATTVPPVSTTVTPFVPQYKYQTVITDCGGVFRTNLNTPIEVQYKRGRDYFNHEYCVWSFVPDSSTTSYDFYLEEGTFEPTHDGITFYSWNGAGTVSVTKQSSSSHTIYGNHIFMAFSSDRSSTHNGFRIRVTARSSGSPSTSFTYSAVSLLGSSGTATLPNPTDQGRSEYISNERISAVLQFSSYPSTSTRTAYISSMSTQSSRDYLYVLPLKNFHDTVSTSINLVGFSGNYSSQVPSSSRTTSFPILYLFSSDGSTNGRGFNLAWTT